MEDVGGVDAVEVCSDWTDSPGSVVVCLLVVREVPTRHEEDSRRLALAVLPRVSDLLRCQTFAVPSLDDPRPEYRREPRSQG